MKMEEFYNRKKVLITGNTGFKGAWLSLWLSMMGAEVYGYSIDQPDFCKSIHSIELDTKNTCFGDIRDYRTLYKYIDTIKPDIIFHLAAQAIVLTGYRNPYDTFITNTLGTLNLIHAIQELQEPVKSVIMVTTDKVYKELDRALREEDALNGFDPYACSKSCADLITQCYRRCFFDKDSKTAISICRAGNVIGGGDDAPNRIIPDMVRAWQSNSTFELRNPNAARPYQHVTEVLWAYLAIAQAQYEHPSKSGNFNIGPGANIATNNTTLVNAFATAVDNFSYISSSLENAPHENPYLSLDTSYFDRNYAPYIIGCKPYKMSIQEAVNKTVEYFKVPTATEKRNIMIQQCKEAMNHEIHDYRC